MKFIAAVDNNWAIGNKGSLLARIERIRRISEKRQWDM